MQGFAMQKIFLVSLLFILFFSALLPKTSAMARPAASSASELIAAVNSLRAGRGLPALAAHPILMQTAQAQADFMAATGTITHTGPGGTSLTQRLLAAGYPLAGELSLGGIRAENIIGSPGLTAAQAVQAWMGDAPHQNTMLSPNFQHIGAGVSKGGDTTYYVIDCAMPTGSGQPQPYTPEPGAAAGASGISQYMVPVTINTPNPDGSVIHEVQYGQSLWSIAIAYDTKIDRIRQFNNLAPGSTDIYPGQKLLVDKLPTAIPITPSATVLPPTASPSPTATLEPTGTPAATLEPAPVSGSGGISTGAVILVVILVLAVTGGVIWLSTRRAQVDE